MLAAVVHASVHLSPVLAQNAETRRGVVLNARQEPLDSVARLRPRGGRDRPAQQHQVEGGEASRVPAKAAVAGYVQRATGRALRKDLRLRKQQVFQFKVMPLRDREEGCADLHCCFISQDVPACGADGVACVPAWRGPPSSSNSFRLCHSCWDCGFPRAALSRVSSHSVKPCGLGCGLLFPLHEPRRGGTGHLLTQSAARTCPSARHLRHSRAGRNTGRG